MYKPWPKYALCSRPMSLRRRSSSLEEIVEATRSSFVCESCTAPPNKLNPTFPTNTKSLKA